MRRSAVLLAALCGILLILLIGSWYRAEPVVPNCQGFECFELAAASSAAAAPTIQPLLQQPQNTSFHLVPLPPSSASVPPPPSSPSAPPPPPSTLDFQQPSELHQVITNLYNYIGSPRKELCQRSVRVGGQVDYRWRHFDGFKWVCLDSRLQLLTTDNCLIYSFGVDHDWTFDDNAQLLNCKIHAFDPSLGRSDYKHSDRIWFHDIGIGGKDEQKKVKSRTWHMLTYKSILEKLGHQESTIHYLKVDVEGAEWPMFRQIVKETPNLLENVRQIGVEIHMKIKASEQEWRGYLQMMIDLERAGFRLFRSEVNPYEPPKKHFTWMSRPVSAVYEMVWIRF